MDIFGSKETLKRINGAEKDIQKLYRSDNSLLEQISQLKGSVAESLKRSPDYEREAKQSSKKASEYKNKASETLEAISNLLDEVVQKKVDIQDVKIELDGLHVAAKENIDGIKELREEISNERDDILIVINQIKTKVDEVTEAFAEYPDFEASIEQLNDFVTKVEENFNKTTQLLKSITSRKVEIDNLYREIYGFEQENEEGEESIHVSGLKDELETSYSKLEKQSSELTKTLSEIQQDTQSKYSTFLETSKKENSDLAEEWERKHSEINEKIKSLLPNALTAGLSHAFTKKKEDEDNAYEKHKKQFGYGIIGLVIVSIIPFVVSINFLLQDKTLEQVIDKIPKIVLAIIPLYLPVLWLAFSSSKKMNLSKRLIEEYSHKEVLSKTFEGLSSQINDLDDNEISAELRIKLLQNFMQVYSENPGKLISNYETSDHPIMEVLEQSYKLEATVEKLRKVPGLDKISRIIESKSEKILKETDELIEDGLETMKKIEDEG